MSEYNRSELHSLEVTQQDAQDCMSMIMLNRMQAVDPENKPSARYSKADRMRLIQGFKTTGNSVSHTNMIVCGSKADRPEEMRVDNCRNDSISKRIYFHINLK